MLFNQLLGDIRKVVNRELGRYLAKKRKEAEALNPASIELVDQVASLTLRGGKRTRAFLVWLGYSTVVPTKAGIHQEIPDRVGHDKLLSAMMAIELFQSFALIHDDIIDQDEERRGGPTVHKYFKGKRQEVKGKSQDARHFGESMAILAGDLAFGWAAELIEETQNSRVQRLFQKMASETILGQTLDVWRQQAGQKIAKAKIDELKTAYYSVARPLELGATLAGADQKLLSQLEQYGLAVGRAFQLTDDFLDAEVSEAEFNRQKVQYLKKLGHLIGKLPVTGEAKKLFDDFARFVVARQI